MEREFTIETPSVSEAFTLVKQKLPEGWYIHDYQVEDEPKEVYVQGEGRNLDDATAAAEAKLCQLDGHEEVSRSTRPPKEFVLDEISCDARFFRLTDGSLCGSGYHFGIPSICEYLKGGMTIVIDQTYFPGWLCQVRHRGSKRLFAILSRLYTAGRRLLGGEVWYRYLITNSDGKKSEILLPESAKVRQLNWDTEVYLTDIEELSRRKTRLSMFTSARCSICCRPTKKARISFKVGPSPLDDLPAELRFKALALKGEWFARARAWWNSSGRQSASCDDNSCRIDGVWHCNRSKHLEYGEGFIAENTRKIRCEQCTDEILAYRMRRQ